MADVVSRIGDDNIVISTDYPHSDSRWPEAVDSFLKIDGLGEFVQAQDLLGQQRETL